VPPLRKVDAVTLPVPDLDVGLAFYAEALGHRLLWRNDALGQVGLGLPDSDTELVLTTRQAYEPDWLVADVPAALESFTAAGGSVVVPTESTPVGRLAVVADPFGNHLVILDLSAGRYQTDADGGVTGVG
jgi:predicted enzyme related to lactoylglutathione lyase